MLCRFLLIYNRIKTRKYLLFGNGMNFDDMSKVIHLATSQNLQKSAYALNITAGALSKTLKKVEFELNTQLFDRIGRNIQLNSQGDKFVLYAVKLVNEYQQMRSEFNHNKVTELVNITGPAVLMSHCMDKLIHQLEKNKLAISIDTDYEGQALTLLEKAQTHIAIVTDHALAQSTSTDLKRIALGVTTSKIIVAKNHPLTDKNAANYPQIKDVLAFPFVCPKTSPFCGVSRGIGSDGWPDAQFPRQISFRTNDFNALLSVVKQGHAIAYVPDIVIDSDKLAIVEVTNFSHVYQEPYSLVYKPSFAYGWLNRLADELSKRPI